MWRANSGQSMFSYSTWSSQWRNYPCIMSKNRKEITGKYLMNPKVYPPSPTSVWGHMVISRKVRYGGLSKG